MTETRVAPCIYVLAGTNGAGKSSVGGAAFRERGADYFNPDEAARRIVAENAGLSRTDANGLAWQEGKRLLQRAISERLTFAFETTLDRRTSPTDRPHRSTPHDQVEVQVVEPHQDPREAADRARPAESGGCPPSPLRRGGSERPTAAGSRPVRSGWFRRPGHGADPTDRRRPPGETGFRSKIWGWVLTTKPTPSAELPSECATARAVDHLLFREDRSGEEIAAGALRALFPTGPLQAAEYGPFFLLLAMEQRQRLASLVRSVGKAARWLAGRLRGEAGSAASPSA